MLNTIGKKQVETVNFNFMYTGKWPRENWRWQVLEPDVHDWSGHRHRFCEEWSLCRQVDFLSVGSAHIQSNVFGLSCCHMWQSFWKHFQGHTSCACHWSSRYLSISSSWPSRFSNSSSHLIVVGLCEEGGRDECTQQWATRRPSSTSLGQLPQDLAHVPP